MGGSGDTTIRLNIQPGKLPGEKGGLVGLRGGNVMHGGNKKGISRRGVARAKTK